MKPSEFKLLAFVQTITLILVLILVIDRYVSPPRDKAISAEIAESTVATETQTISLKIDSTENHVFGQMKAPNTLMIFSRYDCVYCRQFYTTVLDSLLKGPVKEGRLKIVCKDFVSAEDKQGMLMAKTAEVARRNGKFLNVHHALMNGSTPADSASIMALAIQAGLTGEQLNKELNSTATLEKIERDNNGGKAAGVTGTPSFILNGKLYTGYMYYETIIALM